MALDEPAARHPGVAGAKAAGLARARAAGLPVLPGAVLPAAASAPAVAAGVAALGRSGPAAAYLAATEAGAGACAGGLRPPEVTGPWVVRSSTPLDDDGRWSGAFASYLDVSPGDLGAAVRGCWASAVGRDPVARSGEAGVDPGSIRVGVLVQPYRRFDAGGTARVGADGTVAVSAASGGPAGVVSRGDGHEVRVRPDGRLAGDPPAGVPAAAVEAAAALARAAAASTAAGSIEWGAVGGEATLLQLGPVLPPAPAGTTPWPAPARTLPAGAERLARLVAAFPGPLGSELVLPWALGAEDVPAAEAVEPPSTLDALREAISLSRRLAASVWGLDPDGAAVRAADLGHLLRRGRVEESLAVVGGLAPPEPSLGRRVLGLLAAIGERLAAEGRLPSPALVWRLTPDELERAIAGAPAPVRRGPDRWEPFVAEVVRTRGREVVGLVVQGGIGAGPANVVGGLADALRPAPRSVLVATRPSPQLAPLLWQSAGLVTLRGSAGAHLFEVARSLGLPTVTGVDLGDPEPGALVAVDGDHGAVSVLPAAETASRAAPAGAGAGRGEGRRERWPSSR